MKYRETAAELIRKGKNVALYCDGLFGDTNILYLDKFLGVRPAVVIDNDPRKTGKTLFDIPIMPYAQAREQFDELYYWIQGNTYQYTLIGALLEDGVDPGHIINYVPVEKRESCLIAESTVGLFSNCCTVCYAAGYNYNKNFNQLKFEKSGLHEFDARFEEFRKHDAYVRSRDGYDCRTDCPLYKQGYYAVEPKWRMVGDYFSDHCELNCVYCFLEDLGHYKKEFPIPFHEWLPVLLRSRFAGDAMTIQLCTTEKTVDPDVEETLRVLMEHLDVFEVIHFYSCFWVYRSGLEPLLERGMAKVWWSLDAGTPETWEKIKRRKGGFERAIKNAERYLAHDAFGGAAIIPKYAFVKGINDNERDFDEFLELCCRFGARFCALQWDYMDNDNTNEEDQALIRRFAEKVTDAGLKLIYTSGSDTVSRALGRPAFYQNLGEV